MKMEPIKRFFWPDGKRLLLFGFFMALLVGLTIEKGLLPGKDLEMPHSLSFSLAFDFLTYPLAFFTSFVFNILFLLGIFKPGGILDSQCDLIFIWISIAYFYISSCVFVHLADRIKVDRGGLKRLIAPSKTKIMLFVLLSAAVFMFSLPQQGPTIPTTFYSLEIGIVFVLLLPVESLRSFFLAGVGFIFGNNQDLLTSLFNVLFLLNLPYAYLLSCIIIRAWSLRRNKAVQAVSLASLAFMLAVPVVTIQAYEKSGLAELDNQLSMCYEMTDENMKESCYTNLAVISGQTGICGAIEGLNLNPNCLIKVAAAKNNPSICDEVGENYREICYSEVGEASKDVSVCEKIKDLDIRDTCISTVAIYRTDLSLCDRTKRPGERDWCYERIALAKADPEICSRLQNGGNMSYYGMPNETFGFRDICYEGIAPLKKDPAFCEQIDTGNTLSRYRCFFEVGAISGDVSLCNRITNIAGRDDCLSGLAAIKKDKSLCDGITEKYKRDDCYPFVDAVSGKDGCEKIKADHARENCKTLRVSK